jgi:hypothetical protein
MAVNSTMKSMKNMKDDKLNQEKIRHDIYAIALLKEGADKNEINRGTDKHQGQHAGNGQNPRRSCIGP